MTPHTCTGRDSHDCTCDLGHDHTEAQHWTRIREENERRTTAHADAAGMVQRAIAKLERLRSEAFAGTWSPYHSGVENGDHSYVMADDEMVVYISANDGIDEEFRAPTADLIATLHATIDPQLAVLRAVAQHIDHNRGAASHQGPGIELARAILGEEVPA